MVSLDRPLLGVVDAGAAAILIGGALFFAGRELHLFAMCLR
jgi:hypothetical protein